VRRPGGRDPAYLLAVAVVLADSSIVTLALPEILLRYEASVFEVSWILISFNLVFAALVVPAARLAQQRTGATWRIGLLVFAAASLACALAPSIGFLVAARCLQAVGGAAVVAGSIELLASARGSHERAAPGWGAASLAGLAVGPAIGGALTQALSWEAIFAVQVPVALLAAPRRWPEALPAPGARPAVRWRPELALGLVSAGLTGALFLLVIMLTEGWQLTPLAAAAVVSVMPLATLAAQPVARWAGSAPLVAAGGAAFIAGGLAALSVLPDAGWAWTIAPQLMIGAGLALSIPALTGWALASGDPGGRRAATTFAARHGGVVIGLLILAPLFSAELEESNDAAERSGTALLLDAPLPPSLKIDLGGAIAERIEAADGRLPELGPAFEAVAAEPEAQPELDALRDSLEGEVEKAATSAFSLAFLVAAALALAACVPIALGRRRR